MKALDPRARWALWLALLVSAAGLVLFGDKSPPDAAEAVSRPVAREARRDVASSAAGDVAREARRPVEEPALRSATAGQETKPLAIVGRAALIRETPQAPVDLFSVRNWTPAPPPEPPPVVAEATPPSVPTFPYAYIGKMLRGGKWEVYLTRDEVPVIATKGAALDNDFVVERIEPPNMTYKHRPSGQVQSLDIGE